MIALKTRIETPLAIECIAFYTIYLGMEIVDDWGKKGAILGFESMADRQAFLEIAYSEERKPYDGFSLQFRVSDLAAFEDSVRGKLKYTGPTARPWGSTYLYLTDPTGIKVVVFEGQV